MTVIPALSVSAHSPIENRSPNVNEVLEFVPATIELYFKDPVQIHRSSVIVRNEKQDEVQVGNPQIDPNDNRHLSVSLQDNLQSGTYSVDIDVVSLDGHALREKYQFEIKLTLTTPEERFKRLLLERTFPEDGSITESSPETIKLWYNETVELDLALLNDKDRIVETDLPISDQKTPGHYVLKLKEKLSPGTYTLLAYPRIGNNVKVDTIYFAVEEMTEVTSINTYSRDTLWNQIGNLQITHWIVYVGLLSLLGGNWFHRVIAKKSGDIKSWNILSCILYAFSIIGLLLELRLSRLEYADVVFRDFLRFNFVEVTLLQVSFVIIGLIVKPIRLYALLLAVLGLAFNGHSVDPSYGGAWSTVLDSIHLLGAAIWIGGLIGLMLMIPKEEPTSWLRKAGESFSKWAFISFFVLALSGVVLTLVYVPTFSISSLITSFWGQMLSVKIILSFMILIIAIWQRAILKRKLEKLALSFQRNLKIELWIAIVVLLAAGILVDFAPREAVRGFSPKIQTINGLTANIEVKPIVAGGNVITIRLNEDNDIQKVKARIFTSLGGGEANTAFKIEKGVYKLTGNLFHTAGEYKLEVQAIKKNGSAITFAPFTIKVPGIMPNEIEFENEG
ncbi:copper resistance protein CopC [Cohnella boryungensis]|uniref:Copper resistance protein CopC n=2 Tax=Cohnella boryungensis TaxID=768479 RepID=A0ABV8SGP6_9BACL